MKNIRGFLSEKFRFLEVKFSIYLNRRVFVMKTDIKRDTSRENLLMSCTNNKGSDQPVHSHGPISCFIDRYPDSIITTVDSRYLELAYLE